MKKSENNNIPSKNSKIIYIKLLLTIPAIIIFFYGCKKNTSDIGLNVQPEGDRLIVTYTDTITINTLTVSEDSLTSYRNSANLLGCYIDPVFGKTKASFLTHIRLTSQNINFDQTNNGSLTPDSIVLYLEKANSYGNEATSQNIKIYELNNAIYYDSIYYSDIVASNYYDNTGLIGEVAYTPESADTTLIIKLYDSFATQLLFADTSNYSNNETFLEYFKGIYVTVDDVTSDGAILYLDLLSDNSKIVLYYHDSEGNHEFEFGINSNCQRINVFEHDYTGTNIINPIQNDSVLYIQGMGGVKGKLTFPFINTIRDLGDIAINKAELLLNIETNEPTINNFDVPAQMTLRAINNNGTISLLPDDPIFNEDNNYFNGYYDSNTKTYKINITRYFQYLLAGNYSDKGLYLFPYDKRITANRVVLAGAGHSNKIKLLLTYTKL